MWINSELKEDAKFHLRSSLGMAVAISFIGPFITSIAIRIISSIGGAGGSIAVFTTMLKEVIMNEGQQISPDELARTSYDLLRVTMFASIFSMIATAIVHIFFAKPFEVSVYNWFNRNRETPTAPSFDMAIKHFFSNYKKLLTGRLWDFLFISFWRLPFYIFSIGYMIFVFFITNKFKDGSFNGDSLDQISDQQAGVMLVISLVLLLFFIVWSIVILNRELAYSMVPFILGDNPNIGGKRALGLSIQMMHGNKLHYFGFQLSFLGWALLSILTCGIGLLVLNPYIHQATAELYAKLRSIAVSRGDVTMEELGFSMNDTSENYNDNPYQADIVDPYHDNWGGPYQP